MFSRDLTFPHESSFLLFGARGTGKTRLIRERFHGDKVLYLDLLDPQTHEELALRPASLEERLLATPRRYEWVVLDEIQRIPKLLDVVHRLIESQGQKFALTGSSARKLRRGAANLLAGRAFERRLYPLTSPELGERFRLLDALQWGMLPHVYSLSEEGRRDYLRSYTHTYLKEEITAEQVIRKIEPFRRFLHVAGQVSGQVVNMATLARQIGSNIPSVKTYFEILEDTYIGILLEPFDRSIRKRLTQAPKFYLFDTGILRAITNTLTMELRPSTYAFGVAFEHFVIHEIIRRSEYARNDFRFSYIRTPAGVEVDLVVERPGRKLAFIEIKSAEAINEDDVRSLNAISVDVPDAEAFCFSLDPTARKIGNTLCLPWDQGVQTLGI